MRNRSGTEVRLFGLPFDCIALATNSSISRHAWPLWDKFYCHSINQVWFCKKSCRHLHFVDWSIHSGNEGIQSWMEPLLASDNSVTYWKKPCKESGVGVIRCMLISSLFQYGQGFSPHPNGNAHHAVIWKMQKFTGFPRLQTSEKADNCIWKMTKQVYLHV